MKRLLLRLYILGIAGINAGLFALYLNNNDFVKDSIWALPIMTISTIFCLFLLEEYNLENSK